MGRYLRYQILHLMEVAGYLSSLLIGIAFGLIGGGGSILTVPVLVYLFSIDAVLATASSLFIVGTTSMIGSFSYFKKGLVNIKTSVVFGLPAIFAVFMTRAYLVPALPSELLRFDNFLLISDLMLMFLLDRMSVV